MASPGATSQRAGEGARTTPTRAGGSRRPVLFLLSSDDGLLIELGPLLADRYRTRPMDSAEQLEAPAGVPWALLIDATTRNDARAQAARFEQQHPLAPLLVICADGSAADWASARSRGMVSAVVERSSLQSSEFAEALRTMDRQLASDALDAALAATHANEGRSPRRRPRWLLLAAGLLAVAALAWYLLRGSAAGGDHAATPGAANRRPAAAPGTTGTALPAPATAPATASVATPSAPTAMPTAPPAATVATVAPAATTPRPVLELLSDARVAFREGKSLLPRTDEPARGDSAFELYMQVLAQDPQNEEARDGLRRLFAVARSRIQADLGAGKLDEATHLLAAFRNAGVAAGEASTLESSIAAARPRWLATQTRAAIASGDTATATQLMAQLAAGGGDRSLLAELRHELDTVNVRNSLADLAARAHTAIGAGALLNPDPDSAQARVQAMQQLDRNDPFTLAAQRELQAALLARVRSADKNGQFDLAQQLLAAAAEYGNGNELASARRQLQDDLQAAQNRTTAAAAAEREAQQQATASKNAPADFIRARALKPLAAAYPQQAFEAGVHGYVIVEFMLNAKGKALDPKVVEAEPARVFDAAALQAVRSGRYDASALADPARPQRARIRISFK
jgi:TonB family protein